MKLVSRCVAPVAIGEGKSILSRSEVRSQFTGPRKTLTGIIIPVLSGLGTAQLVVSQWIVPALFQNALKVGNAFLGSVQIGQNGP